jgi:8-oxo-dGTP pyrophosphatase MutT (NUDIX family)
VGDVWDTVRQFGRRLEREDYIDRPGSYAIEFDAAGRVGLVETPTGRHLPGGGAQPGESLEETLSREVREECGRDVVSSREVCRAVEWVDAPGEGYFRKRCVFFVAELGDPGVDAGEHGLLWLEPVEALRDVRFDSQRWAIEQALIRRPAG